MEAVKHASSTGPTGRASRHAWLLALVAFGCVNAPPPSLVASREVTSEATQTPTRVAPRALVVRSQDPAVSGLSDESRAALDAAPFPMLVLPAPYASRALVMQDEHWCAVTYNSDDGLTVSLHATNVWHDGATDEDLADMPPTTASVRGHGARLTENEGIRSLAWNEHDVSFSLEVECGRELDARCDEDAFLLALAAELVPAHAAPPAGTTVGTSPTGATR